MCCCLVFEGRSRFYIYLATSSHPGGKKKLWDDDDDDEKEKKEDSEGKREGRLFKRGKGETDRQKKNIFSTLKS